MGKLQKTVKVVGYSNYLFFSTTVIAVLVFLLDASKSCDSAIDFCTISIFLLVFTVSMAMLLLLSLIIGWPAEYDARTRVNNKTGGAFKYQSLTLFFLEDINLKQVVLIPIGLAGVFAVSLFAVLINNPIGGIFASGAILMTIFFYSNSAMPVIAIHGLYNGIVVAMRAQQLEFLSNSPIQVPDISFGIFNEEVINQFLTQVLLVAPSEEVFKIFMVTVFLIIIKLRFDYSGFWAKVIAGGASVGIWASYHNIIAV